MGFLDKVKAQAEQTIKQGQEKLDEVQAKKKADGLLRDLGAWHYAAHTGRDGGQGEAEIARLTAELKAHEAEHGPLGGADRDEPGPPPATVEQVPPPSAPGPPPPAAEQVPPPPAPGAPASPPPPPSGAPPAPLPPAGSAPMPAAPLEPPPATTTELP